LLPKRFNSTLTRRFAKAKAPIIVQQPATDTSPFLRLLLLMAGRKNLVISMVLTTSILTAAYSLWMDKTYESLAVIAPPTGNSGMLSGLLGDLPMGDMMGGLAGGALEDGQAEYFVALLNSRQLREELIGQFDLRRHYKKETAKIEDVLKVVGKRVSASLDFESGMIHLSVQDKDPRLAHEMAQWLLGRLETLNLELKTRKARMNREFAEKEVRLMRADLDSLERSLLLFQSQSRMLEPEAQGQAILGKYSEIKAQEAVKELALRLARQNYGPRHPVVKQAEEELSSIRAQLKASWETGDSDLFLAVRNLPVATMEYLRFQRELEIANKKLMFMLPQLEQAKLDEVNDNPVLMVIDPPRLPEKKIKPKRSLMVLVAAFAALLMSGVLVLFLDRREQDPAFSSHLDELARRLWPRRRSA
jgi:tyrosine-protein kinase Etk/Wzc